MKFFSSRKLLFWLTILAWILTVVMTWVIKDQENWSLHMTRLRDLGFDYGGTSPIIALELAENRQSIDRMLPEYLATSEGDRAVIAAMVKADYFYILGYASLLVLLVLRQKSSRWRTVQIALACSVALLDVAENLQLMAAIHSQGAVPWLLAGSATAKWMIFFLVLMLVGYAELTQSTYRTLPAFWRCVSAMLMIVGGLAGCWWMGGLKSGLLIQNGYVFVMAALALLPVRFLMPDGRWCPEPEPLALSKQPSPEHILQTGLAFWSAKTLLSAVELEVFTHLARHPGTLAELESRLKLHPRGGRDFLDALVALGFLLRSDDGIYRNTRNTDYFLDKAKPSYIGGILEMSNHRLYPFWGGLTEALRTGEPQNETKGGGPDPFKIVYADPARLKEFLHAMSGVSRGANMTIARQFPWKNYKTCADIGTAQGDLVSQIALAQPHVQGFGYDLPEVGPIFDDYVKGLGLAERVSFQAGSFFTDALPKADVLLFGHILHDWDLDTKKMLLRKAYEALPKGGAVVVYDAIIDDGRRQNAFGLLMSLNMLIETPGGFDYSGADCIGWMQEVGFKDCRVEHLVGPDSMVVGIK